VFVAVSGMAMRIGLTLPHKGQRASSGLGALESKRMRHSTPLAWQPGQVQLARS
jgi:hypothetical protein